MQAKASCRFLNGAAGALPAERATVGKAALAGFGGRGHFALALVCTHVHTIDVKIEWDAAKAASTLNKHGIAFADAATALHDEFA